MKYEINTTFYLKNNDSFFDNEEWITTTSIKETEKKAQEKSRFKESRDKRKESNGLTFAYHQVSA